MINRIGITEVTINAVTSRIRMLFLSGLNFLIFLMADSSAEIIGLSFVSGGKRNPFFIIHAVDFTEIIKKTKKVEICKAGF